MELYDAMRTTAAIREFTGEPLSDETLHRILENARFAPSGGNRQGAHVIAVRDPERRARLAELCTPGVQRYVAQGRVGETGWNSITPPTPTPEEIAATRVPESFTRPVLTASVVLVFCVDLNRVASMDLELDRVGLASGASIYPLVWNTLLAARQEGFGGVLTTMAVAAEPEVQALFSIPADHAVAAVVPLGRPVHQPTKLRRRAVEEFVTWESYDGAPLTD
ncbi:nitroreductase family protein [Nocardioides insulae]|uniref:nitroreductase family protein n=1 Tax=Nocardioides insulae TaxID=394734 RepID=UPI0003FCFEFC|nr:nitroreductase family protein [Nocardioides insulae]